MATTLDEQLSLYLQDAHAIELQALEQVKRAPNFAGDPEIARVFRDHAAETERHRQDVEDRLSARGSRPLPRKDITARASGVGMALLARFAPDTPGKLVAHASSYERMELATYALLARIAQRAGDEETARLARRIGEEELAMAERLAGCFDRAVEASLRETGPDDVGAQLETYLADAHAIEQQATKLLQAAPKMAGADSLAQAFAAHLRETRHHAELIERRLSARGAGRSSLKDSVLRFGALNVGTFFKAQADTPAKLAGFAYAFEHLEIASYELLKRVAIRAEDPETVAAADAILVQERAAAGLIYDLFDDALEASLRETGVVA